MAIDKSLKQHYETQGGVKNYLGKQKMVKAPKKWKSAPHHPETELAYITKAEKDALIKLQEKTEYGCVLGKKQSDGCANGTKRLPKFNFRPIED